MVHDIVGNNRETIQPTEQFQFFKRRKTKMLGIEKARHEHWFKSRLWLLCYHTAALANILVFVLSLGFLSSNYTLQFLTSDLDEWLSSNN